MKENNIFQIYKVTFIFYFHFFHFFHFLLLLFLFYVKRYFRIKKRKLQKLLINQVLLRWENMLVLLKWTWYLWLLQKRSYCRLLIVEICVIHLRNFVTLIYWKILLLLTLQCLVSTKKSHILKQICSSKMQVCLSMCNLFLDTRN